MRSCPMLLAFLQYEHYVALCPYDAASHGPRAMDTSLVPSRKAPGTQLHSGVASLVLKNITGLSHQPATDLKLPSSAHDGVEELLRERFVIHSDTPYHHPRVPVNQEPSTRTEKTVKRPAMVIRSEEGSSYRPFQINYTKCHMHTDWTPRFPSHMPHYGIRPCCMHFTESCRTHVSRSSKLANEPPGQAKKKLTCPALNLPEPRLTQTLSFSGFLLRRDSYKYIAYTGALTPVQRA
jgi:hypothetical protein